jgi:hypothetical protein
MDWRCGSAPALQEQSPDFKPQFHLKDRERERERERQREISVVNGQRQGWEDLSQQNAQKDCVSDRSALCIITSLLIASSSSFILFLQCWGSNSGLIPQPYYTFLIWA